MAETRPITTEGGRKAAYALHQAAFNPGSPDFLTLEGFRALAKAANAALLGVFDENERLSGYLLYRTLAPEAEILSIAITAKERRRGLAKALLTRMIADLWEAGCAAVFLEVGENNRAARALYRVLGAEQIGLRKNYYKTPSGERENAVLKKIRLR